MNSFGLAMGISEVTCLLAAVLTMPAVMILLGRRASRGARPEPEPARTRSG